MDNTTKFSRAPSLDDQVTKRKLPSVDLRLPKNPLVISPAHQMGPMVGHGHAMEPVHLTSVFSTTDLLMMDYKMGSDGSENSPNLATSWEIEDNGRIYTFYLRQGVRWSDGHPFTADDIIFWYTDVLQNADLTPVIPIEFKKMAKSLKSQN